MPTLLATVEDFDNALEVRHAAAKALLKICDRNHLTSLRRIAYNYPEVHTRRILKQAERVWEDRAE